MRPGKNVTIGGLLMVVVFATASVLLYAGAKAIEPAPTAADGGAGGGEVSDRATLVAANLRFDKRTVSAPANTNFTVTLDNRDAGVLHNVAFYTNARATQQIYVGELFPGVATRSFSFQTPPIGGSYFFRCDVHPDTMTGTFVVVD